MNALSSIRSPASGLLRLRPCVLIACVLIATIGCAASKYVKESRKTFSLYAKGSDIVFEGTISQNAYLYFVDYLEELDVAPRRFVVTSGGGDADAGLDFGFLIHDLGLDVYVPHYCGSSCANYLFTAGKRKLLGPHAFLLWHGGATQDGLSEPPPCEEGGWYRDLLNCDPDEYSEQFDALLNAWLEKESRFFKAVGIDQRITVLGQLPEYRCTVEDVSGWYYSIDDMERLGVTNILVLGETWSPMPPNDETSFCRVDL